MSNSISQICRQLEAAQYERRVALERGNVAGAQHQTLVINRLSLELKELRDKQDHYVKNRVFPQYAGHGI